LTYPEVESILEEIETSLWDNRLWDMSLKTDKPIANYQESQATLEAEPDTPIDSLPNRDWLRAK